MRAPRSLLFFCFMANLVNVQSVWAQDRLVIGLDSDIATMKMMADRAANLDFVDTNSRGSNETATSAILNLEGLPDDDGVSIQTDTDTEKSDHNPDWSEYVMLLQSIFLLCVFPILGLILIHGIYAEDGIDEMPAGQNNIASQSQDIDEPSLVENKVLGGAEGR
uniref:Uncharacterized protein n=1 Tax=Lotharella oceanica TaxID=641309 RepID=A0A7S2X7M2_9EUKA|mmetsp:Transcript_13848/g.26406  ORF Transcript_13848/g.26406 Transcript_13848/m.26406 type:complete len:164 (+) Transcript_13848:74-565(+)